MNQGNSKGLIDTFVTFTTKLKPFFYLICISPLNLINAATATNTTQPIGSLSAQLQALNTVANLLNARYKIESFAAQVSFNGDNSQLDNAVNAWLRSTPNSTSSINSVAQFLNCVASNMSNILTLEFTTLATQMQNLNVIDATNGNLDDVLYAFPPVMSILHSGGKNNLSSTDQTSFIQQAKTIAKQTLNGWRPLIKSALQNKGNAISALQRRLSDTYNQQTTYQTQLQNLQTQLLPLQQLQQKTPSTNTANAITQLNTQIQALSNRLTSLQTKANKYVQQLSALAPNLPLPVAPVTNTGIIGIFPQVSISPAVPQSSANQKSPATGGYYPQQPQQPNNNPGYNNNNNPYGSQHVAGFYNPYALH